jgi:uncharacterized protein (DUF1015 family)
MADIFPFHAYRYDSQRVRLADVLTQPYDKITPAMQERYARSSPYNLISVEKGQPLPADSAADNVYTRAEQALQQWIRDGVLLRDSSPGIYVYSQEYTVPGGAERRTRRGFIALGRVEDYSAGVVFRHEQTMTGPKADRLELLRHTRTHTGQLFMLYTDPQRRVDALLDAATGSATPAEARDEYDVLHTLWPVFDAGVIDAVTRAMADQKLVIADGHHRYETAIAYRDQCRARDPRRAPDAPHEKVMMTFFNTRSEGLLILPTHRLVAALTDFEPGTFRRKMAATFDQQDWPFENSAARAEAFEKFRRELAARGSSAPAIGMYAGGAFVLFRLRPAADLPALLPDLPPALRQLDVVLLHRLLLEKGLGITAAAVVAGQHLTYERDIAVALAAVDQGQAQACFLLNSIEVEKVTAIALSGQVLPQKSTDFYPKLLSGITLYRMD